jgi:tRNA pseudouridine13 synthase
MSESPPRIYPAEGGLLGAELRQTPEDFQVTELLPFTASGLGAHHWLVVEKRGLNTQDVANRLARCAGVAVRDVGFAGLKDRHAVTRQSFTVPATPGPDPDWASLEDDSLHFQQISRHDRKLRRGVLRGNHFQLILRASTGEHSLWDTRLQGLVQSGFPNYFGVQRFGHRNLQEAARLLSGQPMRVDRHRRGLLWSAARSALFNLVLAERVRQANWTEILPGEVVQLAGSHSIFLAEDDDLTDLQVRAADWDLHPTGPLPGRGGLAPATVAAMLEASALSAGPIIAGAAGDGLHWAQCLAEQGLDAARRPLRARPENLTSHWQDTQTLVLSFFLPAGAFATICVEGLFGQEMADAARLDLCVD